MTVLLVVSTLAAATTLAVRGVRRRYRVVRSQFALINERVGSRPRLPAVRAAAVSTLASPAWWAVQRERHRMWRAVSSAEHAVAVAQQAGAPVGDLPALSRQLKAAAGGVDAVLRASARSGSLRREATGEGRRLEEAAADLHGAALQSLRMVAAADAEPVLSQVRLEVTALGAGVRAAGHASQHPAI
ncbi:MAG: hypothetical protein ACXVEU_03575 [Nocardioidaceae bacterium]